MLAAAVLVELVLVCEALAAEVLDWAWLAEVPVGAVLVGAVLLGAVLLGAVLVDEVVCAAAGGGETPARELLSRRPAALVSSLVALSAFEATPTQRARSAAVSSPVGVVGTGPLGGV
jgi:hypothetical protein